MSNQPKNQEQAQSLSDDDLENIAGGNDLTVPNGQTKDFNCNKEETVSTLNVDIGGTVNFS
jgi:hypothetical protein